MDLYPKHSGASPGLQACSPRCCYGLHRHDRRSACWPGKVTLCDENAQGRFPLKNSQPRRVRILLSDLGRGASDMTRTKTRTTGTRATWSGCSD